MVLIVVLKWSHSEHLNRSSPISTTYNGSLGGSFCSLGAGLGGGRRGGDSLARGAEGVGRDVYVEVPVGLRSILSLMG